jgi:hypothetical protein
MQLEPILKKLRFKPELKNIMINAPEELQKTFVESGFSTDAAVEKSEFTLLFVKNKADVDNFFKTAVENAKYDSLFWLAYPKGTSKKYKSDVNRDSLWKMLLPTGYRPVMQIAIDEDWSALRFRPIEEVKSK